VRPAVAPADQLEGQHVDAGCQQQRELDAKERVGATTSGSAANSSGPVAAASASSTSG
jgi:hypothetical protein